MQENFIEFGRFPDMQSAMRVTYLFEKNDIPFEVVDSTKRFDVAPSTQNSIMNEVILKVRDVDFERAFTFATPEQIDEISEVPYSQTQETEEPEDEAVESEKTNTWRTGIISAILFFLVSIRGGEWRFTLILMVVIFIHELGHFLAMKAFNYKDVSIFFIPFFGGIAMGKPTAVSQKKESIILLAGPLPGVVLGIALMSFAQEYDNSDLYFQAGNIFLYLNYFNLLPLFPLDGGQLITKVFIKKNLQMVTKAFYFFSIVMFIYIAIKLNTFWLLILPISTLPFLFKKTNSNEIDGKVDESNQDQEESYIKMNVTQKLLLLLIWILVFCSPLYFGIHYNL
jgi:Zn-dependent protease